MNFFTHLSDLLYKRQKVLEYIAVFLIFSAVAFTVDDGNSKWVWSNYPFVALILILLTVFIAIIWARIEKKKVQSLMDEIKNIREKEPSKLNEKLNELSLKQKEVFDLITQGKSNKEIIAELVIELSTLKSHINQIYKKLGITNRREAQSIGKTMNKAE